MDKKRAQYLNELRKDEFRVTIFGSARVKKGNRLYEDIYSLGKTLAQRGIDIVTGGGPGLMAAASNGHKEGRKNNHAHAIGLEIELPNAQKTNEGVDVMRKFQRFSNRLDNFMLLSNIIVVTPGGVGTLLELFYSWQLVQKNKIATIPIIILGEDYKGLIKWLKEYQIKRKYFDRKDLDLLYYCKNAKEIMKIIENHYSKYKKQSKRDFKQKFTSRLKRYFG